jgi:hypothetical protein
MPTYKVIIMRFRGESSTFKRGLTLEQAQAICSDPETSSSTASDPTKYGESPWFFGFTEEK